jgi:hypothetical protein
MHLQYFCTFPSLSAHVTLFQQDVFAVQTRKPTAVTAASTAHTLMPAASATGLSALPGPDIYLPSDAVLVGSAKGNVHT